MFVFALFSQACAASGDRRAGGGCRGREHTLGVLPCSVVPHLRGIDCACIGSEFEIILCAFVVISRFEMAFSVACVH